MYIQEGSVKLSVVNEVGKEAVVAMRAALDVFTADAAPDSYAEGVEWIVKVEAEIRALEGSELTEKSAGTPDVRK